jgi:hypothetical protein
MTFDVASFFILRVLTLVLFDALILSGTFCSSSVMVTAVDPLGNIFPAIARN